MRSGDAALSAYLTLSLAHAPSSLSLSLIHSLTLHAASPSPCFLLFSPVIILLHHKRACVLCCSLVALRAVCNHWKGIPVSVHKVEFTDGNTIHPPPQAPPPPPTTLPSIRLFDPPPQLALLSSFFPPLQAHACDRTNTFSTGFILAAQKKQPPL